MKLGWTVLIIGLAAPLSAEEPPAKMMRFVVKTESPQIPKDSFAAEAKAIYRAGSKYCRIEENPDLKNGIHGLMIINEPDVWMVNRLDKSARHIVDPGPTYNCRLPIFVSGEDIKSAADLKTVLMDLEFGKEVEFFRSRVPAPSPGPLLLGQETMAYGIKVSGVDFMLFLGKQSGKPVAIVRKDQSTREIVWYGEYTELPFDAKLFAKPEGVKIQEVKQ